MVSWDVAVMAMIGVSAMGFLIADGERSRVRYIQAMRRCLARFADVLRFEQPELAQLLRRVNLRSTVQERQLTQMLHACADRLDNCVNPQLMLLFAGECACSPGYGVLTEEDKTAFETFLGELGRTGLDEQMKLIGEADERLRRREAEVEHECAQRSRLIRTLGVTAGAAVFLLLI